MNERTWKRLGGAAGILFVLVGLLLFAVLEPPSPPALEASAREVHAYQVDEQASIYRYLVVWQLATFFLTWFLATVVRMLQLAERGRGAVSTVALIAAVLALVFIYLTLMLEAAAAFRPEQTPPEVTRALWDLSYLPLAVSGIPFFALFAAIAILILRQRVFTAWLGWLAALVAVAHLPTIGAIAGPASPVSMGGTLGAFGFLGFLAWTLACGIVLVVRPPTDKPQHS